MSDSAEDFPGFSIPAQVLRQLRKPEIPTIPDSSFISGERVTFWVDLYPKAYQAEVLAELGQSEEWHLV